MFSITKPKPKLTWWTNGKPDPEILDIERYSIFFISQTHNIQIAGDLPEKTYLVYDPSYTVPDLDGIKNLAFETFSHIYTELDMDCLILVGLNKIVTPSNRCDFVQEYLCTMTATLPKISIDTDPFLGEPWRLFFHYHYTDNNKFGYPHGYAIQTEWKHWFKRDTPQCILSPMSLKNYLYRTYASIDPLSSKFRLTPVSSETEEWYLEAKRYVFGMDEPKHREKYPDYYAWFKENYTPHYFKPKSMLNGLTKLCNRKLELDFSEREKYDLFRLNQTIELPQLPIYKFIIEENRRRMQIYNTIANVRDYEWVE